MLVDVNVLLFAVDELSPFHGIARPWLQEQLNGPTRVGMPWGTLTAFLRIVTNPRIYTNPLSGDEAWSQVEAWLGAPAVWIPPPGESHVGALGLLVRKYQVAGDLVPDAHLAALALEHGLTVCSFDSDFARFAEVPWLNPAHDAKFRQK